MGGAGNRFFTLLSTTTSTTHPFHRFPYLLRLARHSKPPLFASSSLSFLSHRHSHSSRPTSSSASPFPPNSSHHFHSHSHSPVSAAYPSYADSAPLRHSHPWPEWSHFLDSLFAAGYNGINGQDEFTAVVRDLPEEFMLAANVCLAFARQRAALLRLLSRRDLEVVVENGTPFLFQNGDDSVRRMRLFLGQGDTNALDIDKAQTVDLMRFILSYASTPVFSSDRNNLYNRKIVESSVRTLLGEMAKLCLSAPDLNFIGAMQSRSPDNYGESVRPFGKTIEMKRGDWICQRCNFMNFARNMKCLECEEARPKRQLTGNEWECPQCDFFNYGRNTVCLRCDCKRPGEVSLGSTKNRLDMGYENVGNYQGKDLQAGSANRSLGRTANRTLDEILGRASVPESYSTSTNPRQNVGTDAPSSMQSSVSSEYGQPNGGNSNYSQFVPLPEDTFARKPENSSVEERMQLSEKPQEQAGSKDDEREQAEKSERWFKRVAELHDVTDLASAISDEDFPEIMPMRKGENRFVVSKKKDRSLTTPAYKRRSATEQAGNANYVPFVPFPPDYFAKKNKQQTEETDLTNKTADETTATMIPENNPSNNMVDARPGKLNADHVQQMKNQQSSVPLKDSARNFANSSPNTTDRLNSGSSGKENSNQTASSTWNPPQESNDQNIRQGWTGKSLEGSAVKEPDHLDMSEEAKAERWFKRVAQIKDISELSQIPDEDFPSIMPMRKGVNRFVVSKRKTPLERRLTSPQYRKNLPIVSSDPAKERDGN